MIFENHPNIEMIKIVDGRKEIVDEIKNSPGELQTFISNHFKNFLKDSNFLESISAQFNPDPISQKRCDIIIDRFKNMTGF